MKFVKLNSYTPTGSATHFASGRSSLLSDRKKQAAKMLRVREDQLAWFQCRNSCGPTCSVFFKECEQTSDIDVIRSHADNSAVPYGEVLGLEAFYWLSK